MSSGLQTQLKLSLRFFLKFELHPINLKTLSSDPKLQMQLRYHVLKSVQARVRFR